MAQEIKKLQDNDGHWYWIPKDKVMFFNNDVEAMSILDYMDDPERFDAFEEDYGKYATGGSPDFFKNTDTSNPDDMVVNPIVEVPDYIQELSDLYESQKDLIHSCMGIPPELQGQMLEGVKKMRDMCAKFITK